MKQKEQISLKEIRENYYHMRDFEISNLWQRSIFLSALLVLFFTFYGCIVSELVNNNDNKLILSEICCAIALAGIIFSIIWIMMAKGSKAWYEVYERCICEIEEEKELNIPKKYRMGAECSPWEIDSNLFTKKAGKHSVSKLNIMIGLFLLIIWFLILFIHYVYSWYFVVNKIICCKVKILHVIILILIPVCFLIVLITALCNSWAKSNTLKEKK